MAIDVYKQWLGIPEGDRPPDHYQLLRLLRFEDDSEKVRSHYKKLNAHVRKYATGQYQNESQNLLNELAKAMLCLTDPQRKREYDESLGREFEEQEDILGRKPLGEVLCEDGHISKDQLTEARSFAEARGLSMRDAVVQMKLVDAETAARALARERGLPFVELSEMTPDDSVLDRIPRKLVKRHSMLPLFIDDGTLLVACVDQPEPELEDEIRLRMEMPMRGVIATPLSINQGIAKFYAHGMRDESQVAEPSGGAKTKAKSASKAKASASTRTKRFAQLSDEEQRQKKQLAIIFGLWSIVGSAVVDWFVLTGWIIGGTVWPVPFLLTFLIPPAVGVWLWKFYLK